MSLGTADSFEFPVGSTAGSVVEASVTFGYRYIRDALLFPPPGLCRLVCKSRSLVCYLRHKVVYRTGHWNVPSLQPRRGKSPSMPGRSLSAPVTAGVLTTTTTTITSTVATPAASAGLVYLPVSARIDPSIWSKQLGTVLLAPARVSSHHRNGVRAKFDGVSWGRQ